MKILTFRPCVALIAIAACFATHTAFASKASQLDLVKKELRAASAGEMPARATQLVSQAKTDAREATAETVIAAATDLRPVAAVCVVSAIARDNPAVAATAAAKAAALQSKQAAVFAGAAAGAAPGQAGKIVYAVCKAVPMKYSAVATAVAQAVPNAIKEVLEAVCAAVPALQPFVERASAGAEGDSMSSIMGQTESLVQATAQAARTTPERVITSMTTASAAPAFAALPPPSVGPPFTPLSGSPAEITRINSVEVPPGGGRDYSGP
jgi:hypothetical protein